jgi:sorbitol-specific phosphotransferase system component IIBC
MRNNIFFAFLFITLLTLLNACSEDTSTPDTISEFNVTGMTCVHGCGGSIRKGLYEKEMATQVDIEFNEETGLGNIAVYHNKNGVSSDQIKELIEQLNDGQFEVEFVGSKDYTASEEPINSNGSSSSNEDATVEAQERLITFPNITDLLNSLIH